MSLISKMTPLLNTIALWEIAIYILELKELNTLHVLDLRSKKCRSISLKLDSLRLRTYRCKFTEE